MNQIESNKFLEGLEIDPNIEIDNGDNIKIVPFEINGKKYEIRSDIVITSDKKRIGEFKFYLLNNPKIPNKKNFKNDQQYQIALQKSQVGITGTGDYFSVLSKVISIILKYSENNNLNYITFTADEKNRQSLYQKIIIKLIKKYNIKYKKLDKNPINGSDLSEEEFWLEKI